MNQKVNRQRSLFGLLNMRERKMVISERNTDIRMYTHDCTIEDEDKILIFFTFLSSFMQKFFVKIISTWDWDWDFRKMIVLNRWGVPNNMNSILFYLMPVRSIYC